MKYLIAILVLLPFTAAAHQPSACIQPTWQFVGYSAVEVAGNVGLIARDRTCSDEFIGAKQCTSQEYIESSPADLNPLKAVWVWPSVVAALSSQLVDYSGLVRSVSDFHCHTSGNGLVMVVGSPSIIPCSTPRPVACCTLQP